MRYRELLQACLSGEHVRVSPVSAWQHKPVIDQHAADFAAATVAEQQCFDFDFVKLTPASIWQSIDYGLVDMWNNDFLGRRQIVKQNITEYAHWAQLAKKDPWQGFTGKILEAAKQTKAHLPAHVPLLVTVFNPFFQAEQQAGLPFLLTSQQEAPILLQQGLQVVLDNTLKLITLFKDIGVDGIFFVSQHATGNVLPISAYQTLALQADLACIAAVSELPFSMLHLHGTNTHLSLFNKLAITLHCDSTTEQEFTQQRLQCSRLAGTLEPDKLFMQGSAQTIEQVVLARRKLLVDKQYIVSPGCALPLLTPQTNIHAMVKAARIAL